MSKKTTTRRPRNSRSHVLELRVNSPRILFLNVVRTSGSLCKFGLILGLIAAVGLLGHWGFKRFFIENPEFAIREVPLTISGTTDPPRFLDHQRLLEATELKLSSSIFAIDLSELETTLANLPELTDAKVTRRLPGTLKISVQERIPVAWLECPDIQLEGRSLRRGLLIDETGHLFPCATTDLWTFSENLPVISLPEAPEGVSLSANTIPDHKGFRHALQLVKTSRNFLTGAWAADRVEIRDEITLELITASGTQAIFSYYDQTRQLENLARLLVFAQESGRALGTANLIPRQNIPVTYAGSR